MHRPALASLLAAISVAPLGAAAAPSVVPVPARASDPSLPHLAWVGRTVTLKAIARGLPTDSTVVTYAWDRNEDGAYDVSEQVTVTPAERPAGTANLAASITLPAIPGELQLKLFTVRLRVAGQSDVYGTYPVLVDATLPVQTGSTATIAAPSATSAQLAVMREAALDEALWFLHKVIGSRSGTGAEIVGSTGTLGTFADSDALVLNLFASAGRLPAFPPGTMTWPDAGREAENDRRWNQDPYAEDAARLFNKLASYLAPYAVDAAAEADDGTSPIPGTNDGVGLWASGQNVKNAGGLLEAFASSGLGGVALPMGNATWVKGKSLEVVAQQIVDFLAFAQIGTVAGDKLGGWSYGPADGGAYAMAAEGSHRQIFGGLEEAVRSLGSRGVHVNSRLRMRAGSLLRYVRMASDGLSYWYVNQYGPPGQFGETADALLGGRFLGFDAFSVSDATFFATDARGLTLTRGGGRQQFDAFLAALGASWLTSQVGGVGYNTGLYFNDSGTNPTPFLRTDGKANLESIWALANALSRVDPAMVATVGGHDWQRELSIYLVRNQDGVARNVPGSFAEAGWGGAAPMQFYTQPTALGALALVRMPGPDAYCPLACSGHGACDSFETRCSCESGFVGSGCQYSRTATCTDHGEPAEDGSCACDGGWVGPACQHSRATTCADHGDPADDGSCACDLGWAGSETCAACGDGSVAILPGSLVCTPCDAGSTSNAGHDACDPCADGFFGSAAGSTCLPCEAGFTSISGAIACDACPVGFTSTTGSATCDPCAAGFTSNLDGTACVACPDGRYSAEGGACVACPIGRASNPEHTACDACSAGTVAPLPGSATCAACPAGFTSSLGAAICTACPAGRFADAEGSPACAPCATGTFADPGSALCEPCAAGTFAAAPESATCDGCAVGFTSPSGSATCDPCAAGFTSNLDGTACVACSDGRVSAAGGVCIACAVGYASNVAHTACVECGPGTVAPLPGSATCAACAAGFTSSAGAATCIACPAGQYADAESSPACLACPDGTFAPDPGSATCAACTGETASAAGAASCVDCAPGSAAAADHSSCVPCAPGTAGASAGAGCAPCAAGAFTASAGATACSPCAAGETSTPDGTGCSPCAAGTFAAAPGSTCVDCPAGSFASDPGAIACAPCAPGSFAATTGADACAACDPGWVAAEGSLACTACAPGTSPSDAATCAACPAGTFSAAEGSAACAPCAPGTWSAAGQNGCTPCAEGWYGGAGGCSECPTGSFASAPGSAECAACAAGTAAAAGADACTACVPGTFSAAGAPSCSPCPAGTFAAGAGALTCERCGDDTFSAEGASACTACPPGTQSGLEATECTPVPEDPGGCGGCGGPAGAGSLALLLLVAALRRLPRRAHDGVPPLQR